MVDRLADRLVNRMVAPLLCKQLGVGGKGFRFGVESVEVQVATTLTRNSIILQKKVLVEHI